MANVRFGIGVVGVVVVVLANAPTTCAQSDELPRRLRERISRTRGDWGFPSAASAFDAEVKITPSDGAAFDFFGTSVAISGDTAIVGSREGDGNELFSGAVYVYGRHEGGSNNWGEITKITASDGRSRDAFGVSLAMSGDTVIVGAVGGGNEPFSGAAYIYIRDEGGVDNWGEVAKITASDRADDDVFGASVDISGDTAIVGAWGDDDKATGSGSAYVYQRNQGGVNNWGEVTKITASDGDTGDAFGSAVAVSGDRAIIGAADAGDKDGEPGSAYVFYETGQCLTDAECADGNACNGAETCNTETETCLSGTPVDCDGNSVDDACDLAECAGDPGCDDCDGNGIMDRCDIAGGQPDVNDNGQLDQCEPACTDNASCADSELCSFDRCIDSLCWNYLDARYGDIASPGGICAPDGGINLYDIIAVLNAFAGAYADGCELGYAQE